MRNLDQIEPHARADEPAAEPRRARYAIGVLLGLLTACGGSESTQPLGNRGTLEIQVASTGVDIDFDGFLVSVDGQTPQRVSANGSLTVDVPTGSRRITLTSVASNCSATGGTEQTVTAVAGRTTTVAYAVACRIREIAFTSTRTGKTQVYIMNRDGTNVRQISDNSALEIATSWSLDGSRFLLGRNPGDNLDVYVMDADGSNRRRLTTTPGFDGSAAWSPDGTRIVFRTERDGNPELYVMNADGSNQVRLTNTPAADEDVPQWSPDGTRILYQITQNNLTELRVMRTDGTDIRSLSLTGIAAEHPSWSPDGSQIAFVGHILPINDPVNRWQVMIMRADGTGRVQLTNGVTNCLLPQWSPDGRTLAYVNLFENFQVRLINVDGTGEVIIPSSAAYADYWPLWRQ